ncbi:MAG: glycosyltransferase [Betaproteobacteria bacterium]|nr:glycosyltransferase [Betaproteobacteria bacterium]
MPRVSVVMAVYNGARFVDDALRSIFAQTFTDYEIICVDDGSTDASWDLLETYQGRLNAFRQNNRGQGAARNAGAAQATGEFLAFLDQDDCWYPHKLARQVEALDADSSAVLVYSNSDRMDQEGRVTQTGATSAEWASALASPLGRLVGEGLVLPSSMMVRRDAFMRVSGFDVHLRGFEDFDLSARLRRIGRFLFLEEPALCYRQHEAGFSQAGGMAVIRSQERFLLRMQALYPGEVAKERLIRIMLAECYSDRGWAELREGNRRGSLAFLGRSIQHDPTKLRTYLRLLRALGPFVWGMCAKQRGGRCAPRV